MGVTSENFHARKTYFETLIPKTTTKGSTANLVTYKDLIGIEKGYKMKIRLDFELVFRR